MILNGIQAWQKFQEIISESYEFLYLVSAWVGPKFAKEINNIATAKEVIIVLRDMGMSNIKAIEYLKNFDVRIYKGIDSDTGAVKPLHDKYLITDLGLLVGSANFTYNSFFVEKNHIIFYENTTTEWLEFYNDAIVTIKNSIPITCSFDMNRGVISTDKVIDKFESSVVSHRAYSGPTLGSPLEDSDTGSKNYIKIPDRPFSLTPIFGNESTKNIDSHKKSRLSDIAKLLDKL